MRKKQLHPLPTVKTIRPMPKVKRPKEEQCLRTENKILEQALFLSTLMLFNDEHIDTLFFHKYSISTFTHDDIIDFFKTTAQKDYSELL